jgi:hypothetical protein
MLAHERLSPRGSAPTEKLGGLNQRGGSLRRHEDGEGPATRQDRRVRSKQVTDIALAEFKMNVHRATSGHSPSLVLPLSTFMFDTDQLLSALKRGELTAAKLREIAIRNEEMEKAVLDIDKAQRRQSREQANNADSRT